jgi:hypothetical protein
MFKGNSYTLAFVLTIVLGSMSKAQQANIDFKISNVGPVMQVVSNHGMLGGGETKYTGFFDTEYPAGSGIQYGTWALWIGGVKNGIKSVDEGGPWTGTGFYGNRVTMYATSAPWDSIWVVDRGQTVDIPYWPSYTGVSDQDLVCRYNDNIQNIPGHSPMYLEVIQVTYAWTSLEFLVHQFWIRPLQGDVQDVYVGTFGNASIGKFSYLLGDPNEEFGSFDTKNHLGLEQSNRPPAAAAMGPIGWRLVADVPDSLVHWTWLDGSAGGVNIMDNFNTDEIRYTYMKAGILHDPVQGTKYGHCLYAIGPFQLHMGDTLHFTLGEILGVGLNGVVTNLDRFLKLRSQGYQTPAPPPRPPLRFATANHQVTLNWQVQPGDVNPETYTDKYRGDGDLQPFEGYRVYKSYDGPSGPWTFVADFDRSDDNIGKNTGLQHSFTDYGLLNNLLYYYTVTAYSKADTVMQFNSMESSLNANSVAVVPGTATPSTVGQVAVVPNPYRGDQKYYATKPAWEVSHTGGTWIEEDRRIQFVNLPSPCEIKIYTLAGQYVNTIRHDSPGHGYEDWNLTSHVGQTVASGIYLFSAQDLSTGKVQVGKFVIIK